MVEKLKKRDKNDETVELLDKAIEVAKEINNILND